MDTFLGQPVNTLTTLAFVVAGGIVMRRGGAWWVGAALIATGVGSFVFHGPMPPAAEWLHDTTLAWLLLVVAGVGRRLERCTHLPGLLALGVLFALFPILGDPVGVALAVLAIGLILADERTARTTGPVLLLIVVATIGRLGATGGPLCDPSSPFQTHALWHVGSAAAVTWWALARSGRSVSSQPHG